MKKNYLCGTLMLLSIACGVTLQHEFTRENLSEKSTLLEKPFSNVDFKNDKPSESASIPDSALETIYSSIAAREYHVTKDPATGIPQSPNRKQNLRAYFKPGTFTVRNRIDSAGHNFHLTLMTEGVYADNQKLPVSKRDTATIISENKIQLKQGILTEEYINSEAGIRQNFIIQNAPKSTKQLEVRMMAEGLTVQDLQNNKLAFYSGNVDANDKLTYDGLKCWDANGKDLPAKLSYKGGFVQIAVNTSSAAFPITIDPIISYGNPGNANVQLAGKQQGAQAGESVASAGDVNGDGYSDVIVGAPFFDSGKKDQGAFFIYFGSSIGLNPNGILCTGDNKVGDAYFAQSLSGAGDVNGDGFSDVIAGSYAYANGEAGEGAAYIFYGSAAGINLTGVKIESNLPTAEFGKSVASAGDVNGDGFSDVLVGASGYSNGEDDEGGVFIYLGSQAGISTIPATILESNQSISSYGSSVASAGDVNGDGFSDIVIGANKYDNLFATDNGAVFIYSGAQSGIQTVPSMTLFGTQDGSQFGYAVSSAGDLNGDGYSDIIIGSPNYTSGQIGEGAVSVYLASWEGKGIENQAKAIIKGVWAGAAFGKSVACAGDVNGDGFSDVIVGEPYRDNGASLQEGGAHVYFGSTDGNLLTKSFITSSQAGAELGISVASAGDVNGDGFSDIIVGAPSYDKNAADDGIALVFHGSAASVELSASKVILNSKVGAEMGFSVSKAGDVNGDGFDDVIVGAPFYDNGANNEGAAFVYRSDEKGVDLGTMLIVSMGQALAKFGYSVAAAGDVNGDGYDDVIIGAHQYNMAGLSDTGAGFVYYGSPAGVSLAITNVVYLPKASAQAGKSVSGAGDVNADGFDDVIVGVPFYDDGIQFNEGAFLISYGSKDGIKNGPGVVFEGNQTGAEMGNSVSSAGDIDGDGYDDVVVGAYKYTSNPLTEEEGGAFVFYGGLIGLKEVGTLLELNQAKAWTGWDVAGAGDINGDGFSDVVVGSLYYATGQNNEGAAAVFYGAQTGIQYLNPIILEGNQTDALMGSSVGAADVNGDGYKDILVGACGYTSGQSKEGAVFVYHGSEAGLITNPAGMIEVNEANVQFGYSLSGAGDVNGDGYEDVIVGSPKFNGTGLGFIYHGNGANIGISFDPAVRANLNLYNSDLTTNLNKDNLGIDDFGIGLFAKSFLGRNKGKLVWEIIGQGESFSHASPITNSTQFSGQGNLTDLQITATELKSLVTKTAFLNKVRARVRYSPVLAITGQVYGPWRYASSSNHGDSGILPVELIRFDAKVVEKQVDLTWETETEVNSDYFELQRSEDGKKWEQIGIVYSAGDSKKPNAYSFVDFKPQLGLNYYRLKMVDRDKTFAYSSIKAVTLEGKETNLFPNPVSNTLNVDSEVPNTEIVIFDVSGKQILSQKNEKGIKSVDVSRLTPGGYLIKLGNKSFHMIKK